MKLSVAPCVNCAPRSAELKSVVLIPLTGACTANTETGADGADVTGVSLTEVVAVAVILFRPSASGVVAATEKASEPSVVPVPITEPLESVTVLFGKAVPEMVGSPLQGFVKVVPDPKPQHEPGSAAARGRFAALGE